MIFFGSAGKLIDFDDLAEQIEIASQFVPNSDGCLTDRQDSNLRCFYLDQKDAPEGWCDAQDNASTNRAKDRINELQKILEDPSRSLQDALPPIYCTYKDGKIIDGLVSNDHPSFDFMMRTTLNTTFDGASNAFIYEVLRVPKAMQLEVPGGGTNGSNIEEIERVVHGREDQGALDVRGEILMINPRFRLAIQEGILPDPEFWESPPWTTPYLSLLDLPPCANCCKCFFGWFTYLRLRAKDPMRCRPTRNMASIEIMVVFARLNGTKENRL